jgi:bacteriocin-like protein
MEKKTAHNDNRKPLELKKSAIARLTLSDKQMNSIQGGQLIANVSDCGIDDPNPCTTIPTHPTVCSHGVTL